MGRYDQIRFQNLRPVDISMYGNWQGQMNQNVGDGSNYAQTPLTPNSNTSSGLDQNGDQPRARKLNENCRCQFCGKCFQVNKVYLIMKILSQIF